MRRNARVLPALGSVQFRYPKRGCNRLLARNRNAGCLPYAYSGPSRRRAGTGRFAESARGISPRAAHRSVLDTLASSGSCHRVKAAAFRCMSGSSRCRLTRPNVGDPLPSLHGHYTRFITTTEQSAPLRRIGTFGLAVVAACAFSLGIAGQVLTFRTRAWLSFAPSTCRMPLGPYQDISRADPAGRVTPRF